MANNHTKIFNALSEFKQTPDRSHFYALYYAMVDYFNQESPLKTPALKTLRSVFKQLASAEKFDMADILAHNPYTPKHLLAFFEQKMLRHIAQESPQERVRTAYKIKKSAEKRDDAETFCKAIETLKKLGYIRAPSPAPIEQLTPQTATETPALEIAV